MKNAITTDGIFFDDIKYDPDIILELNTLSKNPEKHKHIGYDPKVKYKEKEAKGKARDFSGICFSTLFSEQKSAEKDSKLTCRLFVNKCERFYCLAKNVIIYTNALQDLYKNSVKISLELNKRANDVVMVFTFKKDVSHVVKRDLLTRARYLFEGGVSGFINKVIQDNGENFHVHHLDKYIKDNYEGLAGINYIQVGHYHFNSVKNTEELDYENYEEIMINSEYPNLQVAIQKTIKNKE